MYDELISQNLVEKRMHIKKTDYLPPLNSLRTFEVVARHLSITKAANELNVTPGAVSRQVAALESFLDTKFFIRGHREIALTAKGKQYFEEISILFSEIKLATKKLRDTSSRSQLKIRCYTTFSIKWLIPRLSSFMALYPEVDVVVTTSLDPVNFNNEDLDCAIRLGNGNWNNVNSTKLMSNIILPVCSPDLIKNKTIKNPTDFKEFKLLHAIGRPDDWRLWFNSLDIYDGVESYSSINYESSSLAYSAAIAGHGIAIAQYFLIEKEIKSKELICPFPHYLNRNQFTYYLLIPNHKKESAHANNFREWLLGEIKNSPDKPD